MSRAYKPKKVIDGFRHMLLAWGIPTRPPNEKPPTAATVKGLGQHTNQSDDNSECAPKQGGAA
jgi:hypothetical protein